MRLLVLRPEPGASATAERIFDAGHEPEMMSLFHIARIDWKAPDPSKYDALMLTSGNAVRQAGAELEKLSALPVYAVGEATARAAEKAGLHIKAIGNSGGTQLLAMAEAAGDKRLFWLAGDERVDIDWRPGVTVDMAVTYMSVAQPAPFDFAIRVANSDAVLLHSPRAAEHFGLLCANTGVARHMVTLAALSPAIAAAAGEGWRDLVVAESPSDAALLSSLQSAPKHTP